MFLAKWCHVTWMRKQSAYIITHVITLEKLAKNETTLLKFYGNNYYSLWEYVIYYVQILCLGWNFGIIVPTHGTCKITIQSSSWVENESLVCYVHLISTCPMRKQSTINLKTQQWSLMCSGIQMESNRYFLT